MQMMPQGLISSAATGLFTGVFQQALCRYPALNQTFANGLIHVLNQQHVTIESARGALRLLCEQVIGSAAALDAQNGLLPANINYGDI